MKKKVGIIASSVATIAVCASMVVGSTYALFTSEDKVDIAITSGNVEVTAVAQNLKTDYDKEYVTSSNVEADIAGNTVSLNNMTPGDIVTFDIVVENKSTVSIKYRTSIKCSEGLELMSGLEFTVGEGEEAEDYSGLVSYVSTWTDWAEAGKVTVPVTISLPGDAGNEYKNLSCKIAYAIEAVQGNVDKSGEQGELIKTKVSTAEELNSALAYVSENGGKIMLTDDITLNETAPSARSVSNCVYNFTADEVYIDLNGKKLTANTFDLGHIFCVNGSEENTAKLTVCNGEIYTVSPYDHNNTCNLITVGKNAEVLLDNVNIDGIATKDNYAGHNGYGVSASDTSKVTIKNNTVIAARNPVGTNASIAHNPEIVIDNSTLNGYFTGLLFNVDGTLSVSNSTLTGINFGAVIRGGDATFVNCSLSNNSGGATAFNAATVSTFNSYYTGTWKSGTDLIPLNTLVVGNQTPGSGYGKHASATLINTTLTDGFSGITSTGNDGKVFEHHKIYGYGITDSYATVTYDKATAELSNLVDGDVRLDNNATTKKFDHIDMDDEEETLLVFCPQCYNEKTQENHANHTVGETIKIDADRRVMQIISNSAWKAYSGLDWANEDYVLSYYLDMSMVPENTPVCLNSGENKAWSALNISYKKVGDTYYYSPELLSGGKTDFAVTGATVKESVDGVLHLEYTFTMVDGKVHSSLEVNGEEIANTVGNVGATVNPDIVWCIYWPENGTGAVLGEISNFTFEAINK